MYIGKVNIINILMFCVLVLTGCAAPMTGGSVDPSFVHQSVLDGRMAVVGVVSSVQDLTVKERNDYASVLRTNFLQFRKEFSVTPSGDLVNKIGKEKYNQILGNYKETGSLSSANLQIIKETTGVKYAVLARIEKDKTEGERRSSMSRTGMIEAIATRTMTVSMTIYNLDLVKSVFSGNLEHYYTETEYHDKHEPRNDFASGLAGIINAAKGRVPEATPTEDELYPYPLIDPKDEILEFIFSDFARNLPKK